MNTWLTDTLVRAIKTAAQSLVALLTGNQTGLVHASFTADLGVAGMAALVCVLHNIQSLPVGSSADTADLSALEAQTQSQGAPAVDAPNITSLAVPQAPMVNGTIPAAASTPTA